VATGAALVPDPATTSRHRTGGDDNDEAATEALA
jgi:hypothetical protein